MLQPPGFRQHTVVTSLGSIAYYQPDFAAPHPSGKKPTLVFLHGFGGGSSAYEWSKVYPAFATEYPVVAPDLLGWGRSDHLRRAYQVEDYLTTIREFLEQVSESPVIAVASSLTAALLVRVAVSHPNLFRSLILSAPAGLSDFGKPYANPLAQLLKLPFADRLLYSTAIATPAGIRMFLEQRQFARANRVSQEMVDAYLASASQPNAEYSAVSFVRGDLCFDLAEYIPQLKTPTAIFWGKQAQFTTSDLGQRLADLNPQTIRALEILEDTGLTPQLELPGVTIGVMRQLMGML